MSVRKRGKYWHMRVYDRETGEYIEKTTKQTKKSLAMQVEAQFVRELARDRERAILGLKGGETISEVLTRYEADVTPTKAESTQRRERTILTQLKEFFAQERGDPDVAKLKAQDVEAFMTWKRRTVKPRTVNLYRAVLRHALQHAMQVWDLLDGNPVDKVRPLREDPREPRVLSPAEVELLLEVCAPGPRNQEASPGCCQHCGKALTRKRRASGLEPASEFRKRKFCDRACMTEDFRGRRKGDPMLHLFVLTLAETGARSESEVLSLRWEDVDLEEGFLRIRSDEEQRTKTGASRWVPLSPRLRRALKVHAADYRLKLQSPWVFAHVTPRPGVERGDRIESLYRGFKAACKRARLGSDVRPHDLRHTFVTRKLAEGKSPVKIKEVVGHADLKTTMKYTHLVREDLRSVMEPVERRRVAGV